MSAWWVVLSVVMVGIFPGTGLAGGKGVLVLAHGTSGHGGDHGGHGLLIANKHSPDPWESAVKDLIAQVQARSEVPVELAFGMWDHHSFQAGVNRLAVKGIEELVVIPLFVSSQSIVIEAQRYMFGISAQNPLWFDPGRVSIPSTVKKFHFQSALDDAPEMSLILDERIRELTRDSAREEVILVGHGPVTDEEDTFWIRDFKTIASRFTTPQRVHVMTLRDDAEAPVRDRMTARLRALVLEIQERGNQALVVPVLLAPGGIEKGLLDRLNGLSFRYQGHMLAPGSTPERLDSSTSRVGSVGVSLNFHARTAWA